MSRQARAFFAAAVALLCGWCWQADRAAGSAGPAAAAPAAPAARNRLPNPSFELGRDSWAMDTGGKTSARFTVDGGAAAAGRHSALIAVETVDEWGVQFGQRIGAGQKGKTYTFAAVVQAVSGPATVDLQIERAARPWDRAAKGKPTRLAPGKWTEVHVTFQVAKDFPQGWFAYVSCVQPKCRFRVDMVRLYEGRYVPFEQAARREAASAAARLFDTGKPLAATLTAATLAKRDGWKEIGEEDALHRFRGDAVARNDKLVVAFRRGARGVEVHSAAAAGLPVRAVLAPVSGAAEARLSSVRIVDSSSSEVALDAAFASGAGRSAALRCAVAIGQPFVRTEPRGNVSAVRVEAPCRFAVLPDFFADDMVADATALGAARAELAAEHFVLHLPDGRDAIVMAVRNAAKDDVTVELAGEGAERRIVASRIGCGKGGKVWAAVLEAADIWHLRAVRRQDAGKVLPLDWKRPFAAQWRVDWRKADDLTDSWEMIAERPDGRFTKHGWFGHPGTIERNRSRWTTVLGRFAYPCWIDNSGRGVLQPLAKKVIRFEGPAIVYPINRSPATPLDRYTVVDVGRSTLGVGPCEYVLDVEGQQSVSRGRATCSTRDTLDPIYSRGQQRAQRAKIERTLEEVMVFIRFIRSRIEGYVAFGHEVRKYLAAQRKAHPELSRQIDELDRRARAIDAYVVARKEKIKTPEYAAKLVAEFRRELLDYDGADALPRCKKYTRAWVEIGGNQDELVGECRMAVKVLRQRAGLLVAAEPRLGEIAREIRRRSQKVLRNPAGHEGAHH